MHIFKLRNYSCTPQNYLLRPDASLKRFFSVFRSQEVKQIFNPEFPKALLDQYQFKISSHSDQDVSTVFTTIVAQHKMTTTLASWDTNIQEPITEEFRPEKTHIQGKIRKPTLDLKSAIEAILFKYEELKTPQCKTLEKLCNQRLNQEIESHISISPSTAYLWFSNHLNEWYSQDKSKFFSYFTKLSDVHLYFSCKGLTSMPFLACTIIQSSPKNPLLYYESNNNNFPSQINLSDINKQGLYLCFSNQPSNLSYTFFSRICKMCINSNVIMMKTRSMYASQSIQLLKNQDNESSKETIEKRLDRCPYKEFITKGTTQSSQSYPHINKIPNLESLKINNSNLYEDKTSPLPLITWNSSSAATKIRQPTSYPINPENFFSKLPENSPQTCLFFSEVKGNCGIFIPNINPNENVPLISSLLYEKSLDPISFDPELAKTIFEPDFSKKHENFNHIIDLVYKLKLMKSKELENIISREILSMLTPVEQVQIEPHNYQCITNVPIYLMSSPIMPNEHCKLQLSEPRYRKLFEYTLLNNCHFGWISPSLLNDKKGTVGVYLKVESFGFTSSDYQVYLMVKAVGRFILGEKKCKLSDDPINFGLLFHDIYLFDDDPSNIDLNNEAWVQLGLQMAKERYSNNNLDIQQLSFLIEDKSAQMFLNSTSIHARLKAILLRDLSELASTSVFNRNNLPIFLKSR